MKVLMVKNISVCIIEENISWNISLLRLLASFPGLGKEMMIVLHQARGKRFYPNPIEVNY